MLVSSAVLLDLGDNGRVDTLMPDGFIYSGAALDSTGMFMVNASNPRELPMSERDVVLTTDQGANFNTKPDSGTCPPQFPCVSKPKPYPHFISPNADLSVSAGLIWSQNLKEDVNSFSGHAYNVAFTAGGYTVTAFSSVDKEDRADFKVFGLTVGKGVSPFPEIGGWYSSSVRTDDEALCDYQKARRGLC